jgi:cytosine/adenosine deaminase-related metal-dependent hydrolase
MVINNVILLNSREKVNITIKGRFISTVSANETSLLTDNFQINFQDAFAFPGLINSHDHLDFNCFPVLSKKTYNNYTEWGKHIHETYPNEIKEVLKIPLHLRAAWGMYKNLLAGVTTVVNHGTVLKFTDPLITIRQDFQSLHSVKFQKFWKWKLNNPFERKKICVIHTGEGTDVQSSKEIDELLKWNLWKRKLIGIHAVAMNPQQAKKFIGLVWCPVSNRQLLNKNADITRLKESTRLVFGTDSTLTGNWNAWHHLRFARSTQMVSDAELFEMVTRSAAKLWNSPNGAIRHGKKADIVIARNKTGNSTWDGFFETDPEDILMVIHKGNIRLIDSEYFQQLKQGNFDTSNFYPVTINGIIKFVEGDLPALMAKIKKYYPKAVFPCNVDEKNKTTADT